MSQRLDDGGSVSVREQFESYEWFVISRVVPDSRRITDVDSAESQTLLSMASLPSETRLGTRARNVPVAVEIGRQSSIASGH